ncbi:MAG: DUF1707 domain-containing protein [Actinobacteria bacterium]|nr:DUF1707 domain-containing protein [Actinomycetota bacterium]
MTMPSDYTGRPPLRIGNEERQAAQAALDAHLTAGRLDPDEYGERYALAGVARTRVDLDALFVDLPQPHPAYPGAAPRPAEMTGPPRPSAGRIVASAGARLIAIVPLIALVLFFAFRGFWLAFFLIPIAGSLFRPGGRRYRRRTWSGACGPRW